MSAIGRGLLYGFSGALMGAEGRFAEEREFDNKMTLAEFQAAKQMDLEKFREAYTRDIADQEQAIGILESQKDRESKERIATITAEGMSARRNDDRTASSTAKNDLRNTIAGQIKGIMPPSIAIQGRKMEEVIAGLETIAGRPGESESKQDAIKYKNFLEELNARIESAQYAGELASVRAWANEYMNTFDTSVSGDGTGGNSIGSFEEFMATPNN